MGKDLVPSIYVSIKHFFFLLRKQSNDVCRHRHRLAVVPCDYKLKVIKIEQLSPRFQWIDDDDEQPFDEILAMDGRCVHCCYFDVCFNA